MLPKVSLKMPGLYGMEMMYPKAVISIDSDFEDAIYRGGRRAAAVSSTISQSLLIKNSFPLLLFSDVLPSSHHAVGDVFDHIAGIGTCFSVEPNSALRRLSKRFLKCATCCPHRFISIFSLVSHFIMRSEESSFIWLFVDFIHHLSRIHSIIHKRLVLLEDGLPGFGWTRKFFLMMSPLRLQTLFIHIMNKLSWFKSQETSNIHRKNKERGMKSSSSWIDCRPPHSWECKGDEQRVEPINH